MSDKMIESLGYRKGILLGASQMIEVMKDGAFEVAQIVVSRAAAAQA